MPSDPLVRLRAMEPADVERFHRWLNDPAVAGGLGHRYPATFAEQREWVAQREQSSYAAGAHFAIETADGVHIGSTGLFRTSPENRNAELGILIGETTYWGRGYGTAAVRAACRFGFDEMNLHRIDLVVFAHHAAARRAYEKVGFVVEAVARERHWADGRWHDDVHMGLLDGELR